MLLSVIGFLIILGPLVIIHEFGHYSFAKLFGVRPEVFSIGFGPKLWSRVVGETEWRVSAIPLGGYVKLLGEDPEAPLSPEDQKRALHRAAPWKRFFIFVGGPLFNFLAAIAVFMAILAVGEPQPASIIGRVVPNTPAAVAGLRSGDRVIEIQGKPVSKLEDVLAALSDNPEKPVQMTVIHPDQAKAQITVTPKSESGYSVYGEQTAVGEVEGLLPFARGEEAGVANPNSPAGRAGIATGDSIVAVDGKPLPNWEEFERLYADAKPGAAMALKVKHGDAEKTVTLTKPAQGSKSLVADWGLDSSELFVDKTIDGSPAQQAGIRHGDRLVAVAGKTVDSFDELRDAVQHSGEKTGKVPLQWIRDGKLISQELNPKADEVKDAILKKSTRFTIGVVPMFDPAEPETILERIYNPFTLVWKGTERMVLFTERNFVSVFKMVRGEVSVKTLGGPILIGKIAGESLRHGLVAFLTTMAMISIGLGVLNILPVPVLDGGHLLLLLVEIVRGRPLSLRQMEVVQGVGLVLILGLMAVVLTNDFSRIGSF